MQRPVEIVLGLGDEAIEIGGLAEIGGDVVGPVRVAPAFRRHPLARAGDDPPPGVAEALDRRVPDAAAGAGQQQDFSFVAHCASTLRGKLERGSSTPSGS